MLLTFKDTLIFETYKVKKIFQKYKPKYDKRHLNR